MSTLLSEEVVARFWSRVDKDGPVPEFRPELGRCWLWTGTVNGRSKKKSGGGYGLFTIKHGEVVLAHRFAYLVTVGEIPPRRDLDHLCRVRRCIRPSHVEPVTRRVNVLRGAGHGTEAMCRKGHPYSGDNLYVNPNTGKRYCRECSRKNAASIREKRKYL